MNFSILGFFPIFSDVFVIIIVSLLVIIFCSFAFAFLFIRKWHGTGQPRRLLWGVHL